MKQPNTYLIDSHVHFYDCFDPQVFFDSADQNFQRGVRQLGLPADTLGCLCFTETAHDHYFQTLLRFSGANLPAGWNISKTSEDFSLLVEREGRVCLILLAGRQVVTNEDLEVLALGVNQEFADGKPLKETMHEVRQAGALAIIPWGFGKWWGKRGSILSDFIKDAQRETVYLGDNSGRPTLSPRPKLFKAASDFGIPILPGSDPLPFKAQAGNAGRFGFSLAGSVDLVSPGAGIKQLIERQKGQPQVFGGGEDYLNFCRYQIAAQLRKRSRKIKKI